MLIFDNAFSKNKQETFKNCKNGKKYKTLINLFLVSVGCTYLHEFILSNFAIIILNYDVGKAFVNPRFFVGLPTVPTCRILIK